MEGNDRHSKFFDRLYHRAYNQGKRNGKGTTVTAHFSIGGKNKLVANREPASVINELRSMASFYEPEKIMVVLEAGDDRKVIKEDFEHPPQDVGKGQEEKGNSMAFAGHAPIVNNFQGFGQLSVEEYINK